MLKQKFSQETSVWILWDMRQCLQEWCFISTTTVIASRKANFAKSRRAASLPTKIGWNKVAYSCNDSRCQSIHSMNHHYPQIFPKHIQLTLRTLQRLNDNNLLLEERYSWPWMVWLGWLGVIHKPKCHQFNPQSGHVPGLQVWSWPGRMQEATDQCCSLTSMFPSFYFSLSSLLSKNK